MAINMLLINDLHMDNILGAPLPEDTPNEEPIDSQQPDLTCTPEPTITKVYREVVGEVNAGESIWQSSWIVQQASKALRRMKSMPSFWSAYDFQQAQSFSQQTKTWIDQHLRRGLH